MAPGPGRSFPLPSLTIAHAAVFQLAILPWLEESPPDSKGDSPRGSLAPVKPTPEPESREATQPAFAVTRAEFIRHVKESLASTVAQLAASTVAQLVLFFSAESPDLHTHGRESFLPLTDSAPEPERTRPIRRR